MASDPIQTTASKPCDMPGCSSYAIGDGPWCPKHHAQSLTANEADWIKGSRPMKDQNASTPTTDPCPICQGSGTRGQMQGGNRMAVIQCEVCGGDGSLPVFDEVAFERAKDESRYD